MSKILKKCNKCLQKYEYGKSCSCLSKQNKKMLKITGKEDGFYASSVWRKLRKRIILRDGAFCRRCVAIRNTHINMYDTENLEVHHIKPRSEYPELELEPTNLVTLCKTCNLQLGTKTTLDFEFEAKPLAGPCL
ncbi:HNH endonuclease [Priestia megaterium]|uniref:HNH endonuclease n=1 Tax=Priestia megaterium TaxID=1404 RepID=UPI00339971A8